MYDGNRNLSEASQKIAKKNAVLSQEALSSFMTVVKNNTEMSSMESQ